MNSSFTFSSTVAKAFVVTCFELLLIKPVLAQKGPAGPAVCLAIETDVSGSVTGDKEWVGWQFQGIHPSTDPLDETSFLAHPKDNEYRLQKFGTANALMSQKVQDAVTELGSVGIVYIEFSDRALKTVPFQVVHNRYELAGFAQKIKNLERPMKESTAIGRAILVAIHELIDRCPNARLVIDISGDGKNNDGPLSETGRDEAMLYNITINGFPIVNDEKDIVDTYRKSVVTPGGFVIETENLGDFQRGMERKLYEELISQRPIPQTFALTIARPTFIAPD